MGVRTGIAVLAGKATAGLLRLLGRHATTLPGKVALKLSPGLLGDLAAGMDVVLVTGTNGKTTTTHLVAGMCEGSGLEVLTNSGGANMTAGLASAFVADCAGGKPRARAAVLECDEAYAKTAAAALNPRAIIITNLFRDQLDRWGEVTHTQDVLREALVAAPEAVAVLNADDSLVASLAEGRQASARARAMRCRMPPESWPGSALSKPVRPTVSMIRLVASGSISPRFSPNCMLSRTLSQGISRGS